MIKVNGQSVEAPGMSLMEYLIQEGYQLERLAVECNEQIVPKAGYETKILQDGDSIEIVSFVGGG